jgi:hypothetical protein
VGRRSKVYDADATSVVDFLMPYQMQRVVAQVGTKVITRNRRYSSKQKARPQPGFKESFILVNSTDYRVLTQPELAFDHSY